MPPIQPQQPTQPQPQQPQPLVPPQPQNPFSSQTPPPSVNFPLPSQNSVTPSPTALNPFQSAPAAPSTPPVATPNAPLTPLTSQSATPSIPEDPTSSQSTLLISELRDSLVIMKDGSFRAVIACKSINFDLMSDTEREGVEYSFQNFLNSLNFTTQILVRSQRVDIGPYLERLADIRRNTDNMLLGVLMDDYINFIDILSQEANIMDKSFFIIVPYYTSADAEKLVQQTKNFFSSFKKNRIPEVTKIDRTTYDKALTEVKNRVDSIISGLFQIGIQSVRLNTKELSELYYNFNNPDTAVREPFIDFSKMATTYVKKGDPTNA